MSEELSDTTRPFWAVNVIHTCMNVQRGEKVLVITDEPLAFARDVLLAETLAAQPAEVWSYTVPNGMRPLTRLSTSLLGLSKEVDVIIALFGSFPPEEQTSPTLIQDFLTLYSGGARVGFGIFITQDILDNELSADYHHVAALSSALTERLQGARTVHITTPPGTDLHFSVEGRSWRSDTGLFRTPGWGNLPAGEVFIAPVEDSAEGVLVIDASLPGMPLAEPVRIVFERGHVVVIEGGAGAAYLEQALKSVEGQPGAEWARVIGEFGMGTNSKARLQGNVMTDEKVLGTIHVALGRNDMWGGNNSAPIHLDGVVSRPTVRVDGELLIEDGRYVRDL